MATPGFPIDRTGLLVVDLQEKLLPHMHEADRVQQRAELLLDAANKLGLPVMLTQQYPQGLGPTVPGIQQRLPEDVVQADKTQFSACLQPVVNTLQSRRLSHVVVAGIEAHVCVLLSCLDLADRGYVVGVAVDAVSSRRPGDAAVAMDRLSQAGVVPLTAEMVLLEMVQAAGTDRFKAILPLVK